MRALNVVIFTRHDYTFAIEPRDVPLDSGSLEMATAEISKSQAIRDYYKANKRAKPSEVVAALTEQNVSVSPQQVSNVRAALKMKRSRRRTQNTATATNGVSKAQAIRDTYDVVGLAVRPKEVVDVLAGRGITVSSAQVIGIRSKLQEKRTIRRRKLKLKRRKTGRAASKADSISLSTLIATRDAVQKLGGVDAVREALSALEKLSG